MYVFENVSVKERELSHVELSVCDNDFSRIFVLYREHF